MIEFYHVKNNNSFVSTQIKAAEQYYDPSLFNESDRRSSHLKGYCDVDSYQSLAEPEPVLTNPEKCLKGIKWCGRFAYDLLWISPLGLLYKAKKNYHSAVTFKNQVSQSDHSILAFKRVSSSYLAKAVVSGITGIIALTRYLFNGPAAILGYLGIGAVAALSFAITGGVLGLAVSLIGMSGHSEKLAKLKKQLEVLDQIDNHLLDLKRRLNSTSGTERNLLIDRISLLEKFANLHKIRVKNKITYSSIRLTTSIIFWGSSYLTIISFFFPPIKLVSVGIGLLSLCVMAAGGLTRFFINRNIRMKEEKIPLPETYYGLLIQAAAQIQKEQNSPLNGDLSFSNLIAKGLFNVDPLTFDKVSELVIDRMGGYNTVQNERLKNMHKALIN